MESLAHGFESELQMIDEIKRLRLELAKLRWNTEADRYNQWDTLGKDERDALIYAAATTGEGCCSTGHT